MAKQVVWVNVVPPNVTGVYSTEEKATDAQAEMDDEMFARCDTWAWEIDGEDVTPE